MQVSPSDIVRALLEAGYQFEDNGNYLRKGLCPSCGKRNLYVYKEKPYVLYCERLKNCAFEEHVKDALPELFSEYAKHYPATPEDREATANAYLVMDRGFDLSKIRGWYDQGTYPHEGKNIPTVRFYLDQHKTRYWERLIDVSGKEGLKKAYFGGKRKEDNSLFKGDVWTPPGFTLEKGETCFIVEGIFHAIALFHAGYKAVAAFSCNHYPVTFLEEHAKKQIRWMWALDNDHAGRPCMKEHHARLKKAGELSSVCLTPQGQDWDDLHRMHRLDAALIKKSTYNGRLFLAETVEQKAFYMYREKRGSSWLIDFESALYQVKVTAEFEKDLAIAAWGEGDKSETDVTPKKGKKGKKSEKGEAAPEPAAPPEEAESKDGNAFDLVLYSQQGEDLFKQHCTVDQISNINPTFLYMQRDEILGEQQYMFSVD